VPEWFLSQLPLLSQLSSLKLRKLCSLLVQHILTEDTKNNTFKTTIHELLDNLNFSRPDSKSVIAVLSFILVNSIKNCITAETLNRELTDLGTHQISPK
jgi:hypothetical protein